MLSHSRDKGLTQHQWPLHTVHMTLEGRARRAKDRAVTKARKTTASTPTPRKRLKKGCPFIEFEAKKAKRGDSDEDEEENGNENEHDASGDSSQESDDGDEQTSSRAPTFRHT